MGFIIIKFIFLGEHYGKQFKKSFKDKMEEFQFNGHLEKIERKHLSEIKETLQQFIDDFSLLKNAGDPELKELLIQLLGLMKEEEKEKFIEEGVQKIKSVMKNNEKKAKEKQSECAQEKNERTWNQTRRKFLAAREDHTLEDYY